MHYSADMKTERKVIKKSKFVSGIQLEKDCANSSISLESYHSRRKLMRHSTHLNPEDFCQR